MTPFCLGMLNSPEIIALLVLALIFFGAKKLPELAKGLGQGIREFKKASREVTDELHHAMDVESSATPPPPPPPSSSPEPAIEAADSEAAPPAQAVAETAGVGSADSDLPKA